MTEIRKLRDFYANFSLIDRDAPGGFARVWDVTRHEKGEKSQHAAFKVMRPEIFDEHSFKSDGEKDPFWKFSSELKTLVTLSQQKRTPNAPLALNIVTDIYDAGFIEKSSVISLLNNPWKNQNSNIEIVQTGLSVESFEGLWTHGGKQKQWLPYLVVELAGYNDSLYRRIHRYTRDTEGIYRLPTLEAVVLTVRLLDFIGFFHQQNQAYIDWKPEHVYWNGGTWNLKLIDFNVTVPLDEFPGKTQNIADDVRLLAGSALYSSLNLAEFDAKNIIPKSTRNFNDPAQESRNRYMVEKAGDLIFTSARRYLDEDIRSIFGNIFIRKRELYNTPQELRTALIQYLNNTFGINEKVIYATLPELQKEKNPYIQTLLDIHKAKDILDEAYQTALSSLRNGKNLEAERLSQVLNQMRRDSPIP